jgi:hypothetical protein
VVLLEEPGRVPQQIDVPPVADAEPGPHAVAVELALVDDDAQGRRVQQPRQIGGLEVPGIEGRPAA